MRSAVNRKVGGSSPPRSVENGFVSSLVVCSLRPGFAPNLFCLRV